MGQPGATWPCLTTRATGRVRWSRLVAVPAAGSSDASPLEAPVALVLVGIVVVLAVLVLGGWLVGSAVEVLAGTPEQPRVDGSIARLVVDNRVGWLTIAMRAVTALGDRPVLVAVVLVFGLTLRVRRHSWAPLVFLVAAQLGATVLYNLVKVLVARPRPGIGPVVATATGFGFPSAHATQAAAVWGALAVVAVNLLPSRVARRVVAGTSVVLVVLIGFSRLYLGVHWASDVVGGWGLGGLWLAGLVRTLERGSRGPGGPRGRPLDGRRFVEKRLRWTGDRAEDVP